MPKLYPSNWLYNAGVTGFLSVLVRCGKNIEDCIQEDGTIEVEVSDLFAEVEIEGTDFKIPLLAKSWLLESWEQLTEKKADNDEDKIKEVWGKLFNVHYRGFFSANTRLLFKKSKKSDETIARFAEFIRSLSAKNEDRRRCSFCLNESNFSYKNVFTSEHSKILGASAGVVPNSFWNLNSEHSLHVCDFCSLIILCHHLAITRLSDGSEVFINAPSFKVMYYLNKFVREAFGTSSSDDVQTKREILAMSVIEYTTRLQATLGLWTGMNIEIVSRRGSKIEFVSLPYEVIQLLTDRKIASLLSRIGEFPILNLALNQDFSRLMELGYRFLRIGLKPYSERSKSEKEFVNQNLKLEKNRLNPQRVADQIFLLCALVEEKRQRRYTYEHTSFV